MKNTASEQQIEIFPCAFDHPIQTLSGSLSTDPIFHGFNVRTAIKTCTTISQFAELLSPGSNLCLMEFKLQHQISEDVHNRRLGCFNGTYMIYASIRFSLHLCDCVVCIPSTLKTLGLTPRVNIKSTMQHVAGRLPSCNTLEGQKEGVNSRVFLCVAPEKIGKQTSSHVGDKKWTNQLLPGRIRLVAQSRLQAMSRRVW